MTERGITYFIQITKLCSWINQWLVIFNSLICTPTAQPVLHFTHTETAYDYELWTMDDGINPSSYWIRCEWAAMITLVLLQNGLLNLNVFPGTHDHSKHARANLLKIASRVMPRQISGCGCDSISPFEPMMFTLPVFSWRPIYPALSPRDQCYLFCRSLPSTITFSIMSAIQEFLSLS